MTGLARDRSAILGLIVIAAAILMAVLAPALAPGDPVKNSLVDRLTPPMWNAGGSAKHPLGTDTLGRDVASRLLYGARVSLDRRPRRPSWSPACWASRSGSCPATTGASRTTR